MVSKVILYSAVVLALCYFSYTPIFGVSADMCIPWNGTLLEYNAICTPNYTVFASEMNSSAGNVFIYNNMKLLFEYIEDMGLLDEMLLNFKPIPYTCIKTWVAFYCSDYYPKCSDPNDSYNDVRACATSCHELISSCGPYQDWFTNSTAFFPQVSDCDYQYSQSSECTFELSSADLYSWYGDDSGGSIEPPTPSPTPSPFGSSESSSEFDTLYPGGPVKGGVLGAGLLVGLLLVIGLIGLFMKRQEKK